MPIYVPDYFTKKTIWKCLKTIKENFMEKFHERIVKTFGELIITQRFWSFGFCNKAAKSIFELLV